MATGSAPCRYPDCDRVPLSKRADDWALPCPPSRRGSVAAERRLESNSRGVAAPDLAASARATIEGSGRLSPLSPLSALSGRGCGGVSTRVWVLGSLLKRGTSMISGSSSSNVSNVSLSAAMMSSIDSASDISIGWGREAGCGLVVPRNGIAARCMLAGFTYEGAGRGAAAAGAAARGPAAAGRGCGAAGRTADAAGLGAGGAWRSGGDGCLCWVTCRGGGGRAGSSFCLRPAITASLASCSTWRMQSSSCRRCWVMSRAASGGLSPRNCPTRAARAFS